MYLEIWMLGVLFLFFGYSMLQYQKKAYDQGMKNGIEISVQTILQELHKSGVVELIEMEDGSFNIIPGTNEVGNRIQDIVK